MQNRSFTKVVTILLLMSILVTCVLSGCQTELPAGTNQATQAGNDETTQVGNNETTQAGNDETTQAGNDKTTQVGIDQTVLTQEQCEKISAAYKESQNITLFWFQTDGQGAYYLGEFEGCIVFYNLLTWSPIRNADLEYGNIFTMLYPDRLRPLNFTIAESAFSPGFRNMLCAYKDGKVLQLSRAYIEGWLTKESVAKVKTAYDSFIQHLIDLEESGYLEYEKKFNLMRLEYTFPKDSPEYASEYENIMNVSKSDEYRRFMEAVENNKK